MRQRCHNDDEPHELSSSRQPIDHATSKRKKTRLNSKKQLRRAHRRGNAPAVPLPRGETLRTTDSETGEHHTEAQSRPAPTTGEDQTQTTR